MARPREGEGIKRTIRQKGNKFYAYEVTSRMENGKKKTISKYLGRYDPETDKVLERIPEKSKENREKIAREREIAVLNEIEVGDYGGVYLMDGIQRRIGLGQDLDASFGSASVSMMAVAMTLIQCHGVFDAVDGRLSRTWVSRYYGLAGKYDSGTLSRITKEIGLKARGNMEAFFSRRVARNGDGLVAWDTTTIGVNNTMEGMGEYVKNNKDSEDIPQVKLGLATDMRGVPLLYRHYAGNVSDMDTVKNLAKDIEMYGGKAAVFVMDRGFESGWNLRFMLQNGYSFVTPATTSSKAVKSLLTCFNRAKDKTDREYDGHMYTVWETDVGITADKNRKKADGEQAYSLTLEGFEGHGSEGTVKAFVCFDSKKYSDEVQNRKKLINDLKAEAAKIDSKNPVAEFKRIAGKAQKYFDIEADGRKVVVTEKKNSRSFEENRAGLFVMLTSTDVTWEICMQAYDARRLTEQAFDGKKGESPRFYTDDLDSMRGREFLRFLDLVLRCEIAAEIREAKLSQSISVESAVSIADCVQAKKYHSTVSLGEIDKRQRELFGHLKLPVPTTVETGVLLFDPETIGA